MADTSPERKHQRPMSARESFPARMTLEVDGLKMKVIFEGAIDLG